MACNSPRSSHLSDKSSLSRPLGVEGIGWKIGTNNVQKSAQLPTHRMWIVVEEILTKSVPVPSRRGLSPEMTPQKRVGMSKA